jgi:predicted nucleic-acid-binding Zn-ribbon protein
MKTSGACPKCSSTNLHHSPCVMDRGEGNAALCLAVRLSGPIEAKALGQFEVYVCEDCGFAEFYVQNPAELHDAELHDDDG